MKIAVDTYLGEAPRTTARLLGQNMAQIAQNSRLVTGDLESWRQFVSEIVLPAFAPPAPVKTIYKLKDIWLQFKEQVDVARGLIPGDSNYFTFLTGPALYTEPRYTTYALATSGAAPYPFATRPLGMPAPTVAPTMVVGVASSDPSVFSIDVTDDGTVLSTKWTLNTPLFGSTYSTFTQGTGKYLLTYDETHNPGEEPWGYRNFGIAGAAAVDVTAVVQYVGDTSRKIISMGIGDNFGAGVRLLLLDSGLYIQKATEWGAQFGSGGLASVSVGALAAATDYCLRAQITKNDDGTKTVTATLYNGATTAAAVLGTVTATNTFDDGDMVGFSAGIPDDSPTQYQSSVDTIHVLASGSTGIQVVNTATTYVYTYKGANDWESAPSPASATILRPNGVSVTVTTPTTTPFDPLYGIDTKVLYRAVSGASGTAYFLLVEIPLATANYVDELDDAVISNPGTLLESADWDLPHPDMEGIIALPNGIMAGFFLNQLCLSAIARPHAWPVKFRLPTDTNIVAIRNIDNTIVVTTEAFIYTATGNDPASYSMSAPGEAQSCVSKSGMVYLDGYGVVFPSPDGFQVCAGSAGNVRNATERIFEKHQWEALVPTSVISAVYDGILFFWFTGSTPDSGYALDTKEGGFGLIRLSHHVLATFVDPLTDYLYMILDVVSEPVEALLPIASTAPTPTGLTIFRFDAHATNRARFLWRGRLNLMPQDEAMQYARVRAVSYANLVLRVYGDGALIYTKRIVDDRPFKLYHGGKAYKTYEAELVGTSTAQPVQLVQDVSEIT